MKNLFKNVRGFKPVELVVLVGVSLLIASGFFFGLSNNQPASINVNVQPPEVTVYVDGQQMATSRTPGAMAAAEDQYVAPSGDISGLTDAANIENAMKAVSATGATVYLTDGDNSTVDNYYTSRNIVVADFTGSLKGEGMYKTLINAGRNKVSGAGFQPAFTPFWGPLGYHDIIATVFQLDSAMGNVSISDFSVLIKDDKPTDDILDWYRQTGNYIGNVFELLDGDHSATIENVRVEGKKVTDPTAKTWAGYNIVFGFHDMLSFSPVPGQVFNTGTLTVRNNDFSYIGDTAFMTMRRSDSSVIIENNKASDVRWGIYSGGIFNSDISYSNNEFHIASNGLRGIEVWGMAGSDVRFDGNTIDGAHLGILSWGGINNASISGNKIQNMRAPYPGIWLMAGSGNTISQNDFTKSGLAGWANGVGALQLDGATSNNTVFEMKFPSSSGGAGTQLCDMILDSGSNNTIHNWQPCDNQAARDAKKAEMDARLADLKADLADKLGKEDHPAFQ